MRLLLLLRLCHSSRARCGSNDHSSTGGEPATAEEESPEGAIAPHASGELALRGLPPAGSCDASRHDMRTCPEQALCAERCDPAQHDDVRQGRYIRVCRKEQRPEEREEGNFCCSLVLSILLRPRQGSHAPFPPTSVEHNNAIAVSRLIRMSLGRSSGALTNM